MNRTHIWKNLTATAQQQLLQRPLAAGTVAVNEIQAIIDQVREGGDVSLTAMSKLYDQIELTDFEVTAAEFNHAQQQISGVTRKAIERAMQQLEAFHEPQKPTVLRVETSPGIICESHPKPISRVGLYIPGGSAPLLSTVLMLGIPSRIAGCSLRVLCSPPRHQGNIDPHILVAAQLCGIEKVYKLGGAQAIAALAYGTATVPKVDKIFGPGNSWVTQAKMLVAQDPLGAACDMPAGPSEVMVIADETANPKFVAADLLSQAEHGVDSQVILVTTDKNLLQQVELALTAQLPSLSRGTIAEAALSHSRLILVENLDQAMTIANNYAPEHLILQIAEARNYLEKIQNAGSIFLGPWSPESVGDYASGTNHVLPTYGFAKSYSGLAVKDFMKTISVQELTRAGLVDIADTVTELARIEGLDAHSQAVTLRLEQQP